MTIQTFSRRPNTVHSPIVSPSAAVLRVANTLSANQQTDIAVQLVARACGLIPSGDEVVEIWVPRLQRSIRFPLKAAARCPRLGAVALAIFAETC